MPIDPGSVSFPRTYWNKQFRPYVNLARLNPDWMNIKLSPPDLDPATVKAETDELLRKKEDGRAERLAEIMSEADALTPNFARILLMSDSSHPATTEVVQAAILAGRLAHFYFKDRFNRARPSQIEPLIAPVIEVPGHPSYPSGHANHHHMIAMALSEFAPAYEAQLRAIAVRVAENREYAGVHYASDTLAGFELARQFYPYLREAYVDEFARARAEWP